MVMTMPDAATQRPNQTGLPDGLKSGIESLSGMSMDNVNVHYNSSQPAQLNALAYAQGSDIHMAPGHEQHLPHEAWHVVQQAQGRVQPTVQMDDDVLVNDDDLLEHEADVMGSKAAQYTGSAPQAPQMPTPSRVRSLRQSVARTPESGTATDLVTIKLAPAGPRGVSGEVIQGEFAVEVAVGRTVPAGERVVTAVRFGERPNTQFGDKQEDHVVAWTIKLNQIRSSVVGLPLHYAAAALITIIDDAGNALGDRSLFDIAHHLGQAVQNATDDLDLQQAIQVHVREFLEKYNANPNVTRLRQGPTDRGEGARVRAAKNQIFNKFADIPYDEVNGNVIEDFVGTMLKVFQFVPVDGESPERLVTALVSLISTSLAAVEGGGLESYSTSITVKTVRWVTEKLVNSQETRNSDIQ